MALPRLPVPELLQQGLEQLQIEATGALIDRLVRYLALVAKWNPVAGLVAPATPAQWAVRHLLDSLALLPLLRPKKAPLVRPTKTSLVRPKKNPPATLLDVGTGGGLPGLPLALACPELRVVLLDSRHKATTFCRQAAVELGADNADTVCARAEDYRPSEPVPQIVARAVAPLPQLLRLVSPLLASGGSLLVPVGQQHQPPEDWRELLAPPNSPLAAVGKEKGKENGWQCRHRALQVPWMRAERGVLRFSRGP